MDGRRSQQYAPFSRIIVGLALLLVSGAWATPCRAAETASERQIAREVIRLTNEQRAMHGLGPVVETEDLTRAADNHSQEMASLGYFAHMSPNPQQKSVAERVRGVGGIDTALGENLSRLTSCSEQQVAALSVQGWMNSPTHRANMMEPEFNRIGVGITVSRNVVFVTQVFSVRRIEVESVSSQVQGDGVTVTVQGRVVSGPTHGAIFRKDQYVMDWTAGRDGGFTVSFKMAAPGTISLGQAGKETADETLFKIVASIPFEPRESAVRAFAAPPVNSTL